MRLYFKMSYGLYAIALLVFLIGTVLSVYGETLHVSINNGNNNNPGTKESPIKEIDKAITKAKVGDTILIAEGKYSGTFNIGYIVVDKSLMLYGGYTPDFSSRDVVTHPTIFQPDNSSGAKARKALFTLSGVIDGTVIDGIIFDMGMRNSYSPNEGKPEGVETGMLLLPPEKASGEVPTVTEQCIYIAAGNKGGNIKINNNVFLNSAKFAIQGGIPTGTLTITNNIFVSNRMATIEVWGTAAQEIANAEIANNTILFTWSRLKDFLDMGYGVRVMTKMKYDIHNNIIGASIMSGVDHTRFNDNANVKLDKNLFFLNKKNDLEFSPASNTKVNISVNEFGDVGLASADGNKNETPKGLPIDKAYLEGFLNARYSEEADYDPNSSANVMREVMGLNKQGKLTTSVSMFGNRYPLQEALKLFGAINGFGAQKPE
jgi:hypothetical protein